MFIKMYFKHRYSPGNGQGQRQNFAEAFWKHLGIVIGIFSAECFINFRKLEKDHASCAQPYNLLRFMFSRKLLAKLKETTFASR